MIYSNINNTENFYKFKLKGIGKSVVKVGKDAVKLAPGAIKGGTGLIGDSMGNLIGGTLGPISDSFGFDPTKYIIPSAFILCILIIMGIIYKNFTS